MSLEAALPRSGTTVDLRVDDVIVTCQLVSAGGYHRGGIICWSTVPVDGVFRSSPEGEAGKRPMTGRDPSVSEAGAELLHQAAPALKGGGGIGGRGAKAQHEPAVTADAYAAI